MLRPRTRYLTLTATVLAVPLLTIDDPRRAAALPFSDQVGIYALVNKVTFRPNEKNAKSIRVHGAFAVAEARNGNYYKSPKWGTIDFHLDQEKADQCRKQWADLSATAGSGGIVGFGFRYRQRNVEVSQAGEKQRPSVIFQVGMGVRRIRNANYGPLLQLKCLPKPHSPVMGDVVQCQGGRRPEQPIEFLVDNCLDKSEDLRYVFEVERGDGDIRGSQPIAPGDGRTSWKTSLVLTPGETVKWRVRVIRKGLTVAAVASASFVPTAKPREKPKRRG